MTTPDPARGATVPRLDDAPRPASWRCPTCDVERAPEDTFCGRCGAPRVRPVAPAPPGDPAGSGGAAARDRYPLRRALILNGVLVLAVLGAVLFASGGGPGALTFEPEVWRCDGSERAWVGTIPASAADLLLEWREGGPQGEVKATAMTTRIALEAFATGTGSFRVTTTDAGAPECGLDAGTWTMTIRDRSNGALLAFGEVELGVPGS